MAGAVSPPPRSAPCVVMLNELNHWATANQRSTLAPRSMVWGVARNRAANAAARLPLDPFPDIIVYNTAKPDQYDFNAGNSMFDLHAREHFTGDTNDTAFTLIIQPIPEPALLMPLALTALALKRRGSSGTGRAIE